MAFSDFTLKDVVQKFSLALHEEPDLFAGAAEVEPGEFLKTALKEY